MGQGLLKFGMAVQQLGCLLEFPSEPGRIALLLGDIEQRPRVAPGSAQ
jgi:hypothetical protein